MLLPTQGPDVTDGPNAALRRGEVGDDVCVAHVDAHDPVPCGLQPPLRRRADAGGRTRDDDGSHGRQPASRAGSPFRKESTSGEADASDPSTVSGYRFAGRHQGEGGADGDRV
jgi:hypothetical protein